ncbi:MAG: alpha-ribazole phosphatase [Dehalococcoidales bacterium]|jgi:alpha-ribazole phosphatase|nr:alpha-ribazole phosphatase [Dehalococcoidales bacterium]
MARLFLVRHGETDSNSAFRYWGKTDVGLGSEGIRQAEQIRDRLADQRIDCIYTSDLRRTRLTAEIIARPHQIDIINCPELREIDFGEVEGLDFKEVQAKFPEVARKWIQHDPELVYPGGESLLQLDERIARFRSRLSAHAPQETVLIVAHSGVLRTLICQLLGMDLKYRWNLRIDLASLSIVETYPNFAILSLLNDVSHLKDR